MSPEQQRIKIAEACGWESEYIFGNGVDDYVWKHPTNGKAYVGSLEVIPDYLNSLDAMHEAVTILTPVQYRRFIDYLCDMTEEAWRCSDNCHARFVNEASAAQRAEAFLRTLNLWTDEPSS